MAACELRKHGFSEGQVFMFGVANELGQAAGCLGTGWNCKSAMAGKDFEDNRTGYTCPDEEPCWSVCGDLTDLDKRGDRNEFGPFYRGKGWTPNYWGRWRR